MISQQDMDIKTAMIRYFLICLFSIIVAQTSYATIGTSVSQYDCKTIEPFIINPSNEFNAKNQQIISTYSYIPNGQVETITDANGNPTRYEYDGFERIASTRYPEATQTGLSSSSDRENFSYDENGNLKIWQRRSGDTLEYDYDALNRVIEKRLPSAPNDNISYTYDLLSRLTTQILTNTARDISYLYDQANRISAVTQGTRTVNYQYDPSGNRTRMTWPDGFFVDYSYDAGNRLETLTEQSSTLVSYQYDALNFRIMATLGNTTSTSYNYTSESRLQDLTHDLTGTAEDISINHSYNQVGQITSRNTSNDLYDWTPSATITNNYTTNGLNQYTQIDGVSQQHDNQGNLNDNGQWLLTFDLENRLITAIKTGTTVSYQYNAENQRLEKNHNGNMLHYLYDGTDLIAVYDNANNIIQRYVHGSRVDEPLVGYDYDTQGNLQSKSWFYTNHQGSVIATADTTGSVDQIYTYSPFGRPGQQGTSLFRYTGQVWDEETQLAYYKARYYSPERGRFLSTDPAGFIDSLNLYGYVVNDPVNFIDPSGLAFAAAQNQVGQVVSLLNTVALDYIPGNQAFSNAIRSENGIDSALFGLQSALEIGAAVAGGRAVEVFTSRLVGFGGSFAAKGLADPNTIRFSQNSIRGTFRDGRSVQDLVTGLKNGSIKPGDVPAIRTVQRNGQTVSIDNRRLAASREAGVPIRTRPATVKEISEAQLNGKFSAGSSGTDTIRVRGQ